MIREGYEFSSITLMVFQNVRYRTLSCSTSGEQPRKTSAGVLQGVCAFVYIAVGIP